MIILNDLTPEAEGRLRQADYPALTRRIPLKPTNNMNNMNKYYFLLACQSEFGRRKKFWSVVLFSGWYF